jgi:hypothetical protein
LQIALRYSIKKIGLGEEFDMVEKSPLAWAAGGLQVLFGYDRKMNAKLSDRQTQINEDQNQQLKKIREESLQLDHFQLNHNAICN